MEFSKLSAPSLKDLFIQQLQEKILSGELPIGTELPSERELAEQMQVSRAVINGGLNELARKGFIELRPRQGSFVADYRRKGNLDTLITIMEYQGGILGAQEIRSILEFRLALEHLAIESAISNATDEQIHSLELFVDQLKNATTPLQASEIAFQFHHDLSFIGNNSILPLIYYSFRTPVISLWTRFCTIYGIPALYNNIHTLYEYIKKRDLASSHQWTDSYLKEAINGHQQIYSTYTATESNP